MLAGRHRTLTVPHPTHTTHDRFSADAWRANLVRRHENVRTKFPDTPDLNSEQRCVVVGDTPHTARRLRPHEGRRRASRARRTAYPRTVGGPHSRRGAQRGKFRAGRYCVEHEPLHGAKCSFWIATSEPCSNNREDGRLTCAHHRRQEDEFNRRNKEASWTAAQRARFLKEEVITHQESVMEVDRYRTPHVA